MIDITVAATSGNDARVKANVVRLAAAQALTGANSAVIFATGSLIGATPPPPPLAPARAALDVCAGHGGRHLADRRDLARLWPPRRLHHRHHVRLRNRCARRARYSLRLLLAVLLRDLPRGHLRLGAAILSLRARRWRQRRLPAQGRVLGDGGRRVRRRVRSATRAMDH